MDDIPSRPSPPREWLEALERGRNELARGGPTIPGDEVLKWLRDEEARLRTKADAEPGIFQAGNE